MAKNNENIVTSNKVTIALIIVALAVLGGIIYYSWQSTPEDAASNTTETESTTTDAAEVDKLGAREIKLTPDNFDQVIKDNKVVLVDVYSPTCPHCQKIAPILTELSEEYAGKIVIAKMSVADNANREFILNREKNFQYVPALWIYKDGAAVWTDTGEKTKEEFKTLFDQYIK